MLKIDIFEPKELSMCEDHIVYTHLECKNLLKRIDEGNKSTRGLTEVTKPTALLVCTLSFLSLSIYTMSSLYICF